MFEHFPQQRYVHKRAKRQIYNIFLSKVLSLPRARNVTTSVTRSVMQEESYLSRKCASPSFHSYDLVRNFFVLVLTLAEKYNHH